MKHPRWLGAGDTSLKGLAEPAAGMTLTPDNRRP